MKLEQGKRFMEAQVAAYKARGRTPEQAYRLLEGDAKYAADSRNAFEILWEYGNSLMTQISACKPRGGLLPFELPEG